MAVVEAGVMAANYVISQRRITKIVGILNPSRNHRIRINRGRGRKRFLRLDGTRGHQSQIITNSSTSPKRVRKKLGCMQRGQREMTSHTLPTDAGEHYAHYYGNQQPLCAQTPPVPGAPSS